MCDHHLAGEAAGLLCDRADPHVAGRGCTYTSTSGVAQALKEEG